MKKVQNIYNLNEDNPIEISSEDIFGREIIVDAVYQTILTKSTINHTCFTIGLYGKWGEGKTSVLNLITEKLKSHKNIVVSLFNPWFFKDQESLLLDFFNSIDGRKIGTEFVENLKKYGPIASIGLSSIIKLFAPALGSTIEDMTLNFIDKLPDLKESVIQQKKKLSKNIIKSGKHSIIIIDDVDRLDSKETHILFKLIKQTANFDNTIFVVAMDKDAVAKSLSSRFGNCGIQDGYNFIEKIIQMQLFLPKIHQGQLLKFLDNKIKIIISQLPKTEIVNEREYIDAQEKIQKYVLPLFCTAREIIQYSNVLSYSLLMLYKEVNISDLCLLEALKIIYPHGYNMVRDNKHIILKENHDISYILNMNSDTEEILRKEIIEKQKFIESIVSECPSRQIFYMRNLIQEILNDYLYGSNHNPLIVSNRKRLCSKQHYDKFFSYGNPDGIISEEMINELTKSIIATSSHELSLVFNKYVQEYKGDEFSRVIYQIISAHHDNSISNEDISKIYIGLAHLKENTKRRHYTEFDRTKQWEIIITDILNGCVTHNIDGELLIDFDTIIKTVQTISEETTILFGLFFIVHFRQRGFAGYDNMGIIDKLTYDIIHRYIRRYSEEALFDLGQICISELFHAWKDINNKEYHDFISRHIPSDKINIIKLINTLIYNRDKKYYDPFIALFDKDIVYQRLLIENNAIPNLRVKEKEVNLFMSIYEEEEKVGTIKKDDK